MFHFVVKNLQLRNSFNRDERAALLLIMSYFTQDSRRVHLSADEKQRQFIAF